VWQRYYLGGWQEIGARGLFWSSTTQGDEGGWVESIVNLSASAGLGTNISMQVFLSVAYRIKIDLSDYLII
jgi:hypothetical protein